MFRKFFALSVIALLILVLAAANAFCQNAKSYVVLPFNYMGPAKYQHYGKSIPIVLRAKLKIDNLFQPALEGQASKIGTSAPESTATAVDLLATAGVDYLFYGLVSIAGDSATLEISGIGKQGNTITRSVDVSNDQLSLELDAMARSITSELFNAQSAETASGVQGRQINPTFLAAETQAQPDTSSSINQQFRYEGGSENTGRRQSQRLRFASRSLAVCDADGDGKNEVFILDKFNIHAYTFTQGKLLEQGTLRIANRDDPLRITSMDVDRDGHSEIILTTFNEKPTSYVYNYSKGKFTVKADRCPYFLNVVKMAPHYRDMLLAQPLSNFGGLRSSDAMEAHVSKGEVIAGRGVPLPQFANIYNIAYLPEGGSYKLFVLDNFNRVMTFTPDLKTLGASQEAFNSSAVPISLGRAVVPGMETSRDAVEESYYYLPIPMKVTNLFSKGEKYELLLNKDISVASQIFARFKTFTQGEIHSLYWDGTGLNLAWKTRRIKGTVVDYDIIDVDNDGRVDLTVLVNTYPGAFKTQNIRTVLLIYDLNL